MKLTSATPTSFRAARVAGMFDVPPEARAIELPDSIGLEDHVSDDWSVGAIVGSSGSGKTTTARHVFGTDFIEHGGEWSGDCILDDFPESCEVDDIVSTLIAVGLSTPPAWLRPYHVLSTGERFRADLARALAQEHPVLAYDEFSSVVDRSVARAASVAVSKHVRRTGSRFVAVTCHRDVVPWLEADWVYDTDTQQLVWGRLQRPAIAIEIVRGEKQLWSVFGRHHYLSATLHQAARCYAIFVRFGDETDSALAGMIATLPAIGMKGWTRVHRTVVQPDFQGMGIGSRVRELLGEYLWNVEGRRMRSVSSHPGNVGHFRSSPDRWKLVAAPNMKAKSKSGVRTSVGRLTSSWEYIPEALREQ